MTFKKVFLICLVYFFGLMSGLYLSTWLNVKDEPIQQFTEDATDEYPSSETAATDETSPTEKQIPAGFPGNKEFRFPNMPMPKPVFSAPITLPPVPSPSAPTPASEPTDDSENFLDHVPDSSSK